MKRLALTLFLLLLAPTAWAQAPYPTVNCGSGGAAQFPTANCNIPNASATTFGLVKVDGTTITSNNGVISSTGGGGGGGLSPTGNGSLLNITPTPIVPALGSLTLASLGGSVDNALLHLPQGANNGFIGSGTITVASGTPCVVTTTGTQFSNASTGNLIFIGGIGAAGAELDTSIASVQSSSQVTLSTCASTFVTSAAETIAYGVDSAAAINTWIALVQSTLPTTAFGAASAYNFQFPAGIYVISSAGINLTLTRGWTFGGDGAQFYVATSGVAGFDAMGGYRDTLNLRTIGNCGSSIPSTHLQIGRYSSTNAYGRSRVNIKTAGCASLAYLYNMAEETSDFSDTEITGSSTGIYYLIDDGSYHFGLTSQYVNIPYNSGTNPNGLQADTPYSHSDDTWSNAKVVTVSGALGGVWTSNGLGSRFAPNFYVQSPSACSFTIYVNNTIRTTGFEFSGSLEGPNTHNVCFVGNGSTGNIGRVAGFKFDFILDNATVSDFSADSSFSAGGKVQMTGVDLRQPAILALAWDTPAEYSVEGALRYTYSAANFVQPASMSVGFYTDGSNKYSFGSDGGISSFQQINIGSAANSAMASTAIGVMGPPSGVTGNPGTVQTTGNWGLGWGFQADEYGEWCEASGQPGSVGGSGQMCHTKLYATTTSTATTLMTGNNLGTAGARTVANCTLATGQKQEKALVINIHAVDETTGAGAYWSTPVFSFSCVGGTPASAAISSSTVVAGYNTATAGSSLYGAALPTLAADTTNNGLAINVTATGTNSVAWTAFIMSEEGK